jgi:hypothetical protein
VPEIREANLKKVAVFIKHAAEEKAKQPREEVKLT